MTKHNVAHPNGVGSPCRDRGRILRSLLFRMRRRRHCTLSGCSPGRGLYGEKRSSESERKMTRKAVTVMIPV